MFNNKKGNGPEITADNFYKFLGLDSKPSSLNAVNSAHREHVQMLRSYSTQDAGLSSEIIRANSAQVFAESNQAEIWKKASAPLKLPPSAYYSTPEPNPFGSKYGDMVIKDDKGKGVTLSELREKRSRYITGIGLVGIAGSSMLAWEFHLMGKTVHEAGLVTDIGFNYALITLMTVGATFLVISLAHTKISKINQLLRDNKPKPSRYTGAEGSD